MRTRGLLRWYGIRLGILVALVASLLVVPAVSRGEYFGGSPLSDVEYWADQRRQCDLDQMELATLMIAPPYPETGAGASYAPSPMTLSRSDDQDGLHSFENRSSYQDAFWHPGVGMWQLDSAGLGAWMPADDRISSWSSASQSSQRIAGRYCEARSWAWSKEDSRARAWLDWVGCDGTCETFFQNHYSAGSLIGIYEDWSVARLGGAEWHTCEYSWGGDTFGCLYVDPSQAQGYDGWTVPAFGPSPISDPFYTYLGSDGTDTYEYRHWLREDTSFDTQIYAIRLLPDNARGNLGWSGSDILCDLTTGHGNCN